MSKIKTEIKESNINKPIYIIHNLITFTSKAQVEAHINDFLLKSATFELEEGHKIHSEKIDKKGIYYYEKNSSPTIFHLIYANEGSEAGEFYNQFTLEFIENSYQQVTNLKTFDVISSIKTHFIIQSKNFLELNEKNQFTKESFDSDSENCIKLKDCTQLVLKKCFLDELGMFNLIGNGFNPKYNYYKKDNNIIMNK